MKRNCLYIILVLILFSSCSVMNRFRKLEDFDTFHKRFYNDSIFQYKRVKDSFPMISSGATNLYMDSGSNDTIFLTKETLPKMIKGINDYPENYKSKLEWFKIGVDEIIFIPNSGYYERRSFGVYNKRWYLNSLFISNY